jgi:hypothetical protein
MIVEWFAAVGVAIADWVASLMPAIEIPDDLVHLDAAINSIFEYGDGLGAWIDINLCAVVLAIPLAVWAVGLTVRAARALAAHIPFIGGGG